MSKTTNSSEKKSGRYAYFFGRLKNIIDWFINLSFAQRIVKKYPKSTQFFLNRFSLKKFSGLPLTILLIAILANVLLVAEIFEAFENSPLLRSIDYRLALYFSNGRNETLAQCYYYFTQIGSFPVVILIALLFLLLIISKKQFLYCYAILTTLIGSGITLWLGKNYFHRIRPADFSYYQETSYSFPSGHSTIAIAFYGLIFYYLIRQLRTSRSRITLSLFAIGFISLIGFSRIYLCEHYLTDVLAGFNLGLLWLFLGVSIVEWDYGKG